MSAFIGDIDRFRSAKAFAAWFGYIPRTRQTGGVAGKPQRTTKAGYRLAKQHIFLAADVARHHDPELALTYKTACDRGRHHVDAVCIVGHKLLRKLYGFLTRRAAATPSDAPVRWRLVDPTTGADLTKLQSRAWIHEHCPSKAEQRRRAAAESGKLEEETAPGASHSESLIKNATKTTPGEPSDTTISRRMACGQPVESVVGKLLREWAAKCES
jgi:hypothetical protein